MNPKSPTYSPCETCLVARECIFAGLEQKHQRRLRRAVRVYRIERGQGVFYEGSPALAVQCIIDGSVKLHKIGQKQEPYVIRLLGPGDIMSYRPVLADEPYSATAEAIRSTTICNIPRDTFLALIDGSAELSRRFLAKFGMELRVSEEQTLAVSQQSVRQRIARLLLSLVEKCAAPEHRGAVIGCELSRVEMAQMVGTTPETFSRTLRSMAQDKVLEVDRVMVRVCDMMALRRIAGKKHS